MRNVLLVLCYFIGITVHVNAQKSELSASNELQLNIELNNPSTEINDGTALVDVIGGQAPYEYKWHSIKRLV